MEWRVKDGGGVPERAGILRWVMSHLLCVKEWTWLFIGNGVRNCILSRDNPSTDKTVVVGGPIGLFSSTTFNNLTTQFVKSEADPVILFHSVVSFVI